jgi:hypothetical protein
MEPALSAIAYIFAYIFIAPIAAKAIMLDAKLDPEPGEDESRLALLQPETPTALVAQVPATRQGSRKSRS